MAAEKYRIVSPTIAVCFQDGKRVAIRLPIGDVVEVESETFHEDHLVEVMWSEKRVQMFTRDIRNRGEKVD